jgi:hypothetical protein
MRRLFALLTIAACGARTPLLAPEDASVTIDASKDAPHDAPQEAPQDAPHDVVIDAPHLQEGCADGQREGFVDDEKFPDIAGCSGGFSIGGVMPFAPKSIAQCPSIVATDTTVARCNHAAGDDSSNPNGLGCDVEDLCEPGFHVCTSSADVAKHSPSGCDGATSNGDPPLFFVTRQSSNGCAICATGTSTGPQCDSKSCTGGCAETQNTSNDAFGCGNVAAQVGLVDCDPLDSFTNNLCDDLNGSSWSCSADPTGFCEAYVITHLDATFGGALCCRD